MQQASFMVVLVANGPGELATWVKPIAEELHRKLLISPRCLNESISMRLVLVPCPNATGQEKEAASNWNQFEKIISANNFWQLLINPRKFGFWPSKGLIIFLGGDQFWTVLLSARLKYLHMTYAEWICRWPQWNDQIAAMSNKVKNQLPQKFKKRCIVVGDLMADINSSGNNKDILPVGQWVALMPGSKKAKLSVGIPFFLELADHLNKLLPNCKFLLPIAPTTSVKEFITLSGKKNPISKQYSSGILKIIEKEQTDHMRKLITISGTTIYLQENHPAHNELSQCDLALTTVGANTAELAALSIPMIVIVPTQHINVMEAWDGFIGILARMPFFRWFLGIAISLWRLRKKGFMAWPNISAGRMVVPEKIGTITPKEIAKEAFNWLNYPERLKGQKEDLKSLRGGTGAAKKIVNLIIDLINKK